MKEKFSSVIAYSLIDLGVNVITCVPGFGASEALLDYNRLTSKKLPYSFHEEPAYSIAHGASMIGKRSSVMMKSQGLMKAGNAFSDSLYASLTAGMVILVFEDHVGIHSDNKLEIEPFIVASGVKYIKANKDNIYQSVSAAYQISEEIELPVVLLIDSAETNVDVEFNRIEQKKSFDYTKNITRTVIHPYLSDYQYKLMKAKLSGTNTDRIKLPNLPIIPKDLPERYIETGEKYVPFFDVFKNINREVVCGDTSISSSFAFPEYSCIDLVTHIGGSVPLAVGAYLAGKRNIWALSGDFGFISAGHYGLIEVVQREIPLKLVIFNNKNAGATGGQSIPSILIHKLLSGYQKNLLQIPDASDRIAISEVLEEAENSDELRIILVNY